MSTPFPAPGTASTHVDGLTPRVIELGCGPGVAIAAIAARASRGVAVGVDHSQVMIRQAARRNRAALKAGRVRLVHVPVEGLEISGGPFDAALAVNTAGRWPGPTARLRELARLLRPGGLIALVTQPRCPSATAAISAVAGNELAGLLTEAGFERLRTEVPDLAVGTIGAGPSELPSLGSWPTNSTITIWAWWAVCGKSRSSYRSCCPPARVTRSPPNHRRRAHLGPRSTTEVGRG